MQLAFDARQAHQLEAIEAVLARFREVADLTPSLPPAMVREIPGAIAADIETRAGPDRVEFPNLSVEMETGTGKTYVYIRTMLELARHHGLRRFIVVVPSVAIREGVIKTLRITTAHFTELYPEVRYRFRAYDGRTAGHVRSFATSSATEILVITLDAFNKASNILRQKQDRLGGDAPLWVLQDCRPVVVLDEPQNMESEKSIQAIADLRPLLALRYSATHRNPYALVHRLSPAEAHERRLVKRIEVAAVVEDDRERRFSEQIRSTISTHLRRQEQLRPRGVKVLSLFFIDRVASYTDDDGLVRRLFDHHFRDLASHHEGWHALGPEQVCAAYFAVRRRRGGVRDAIDSRSGRSAEDEAAYRLIMQDKERLLSFDEPVAFVFSHSALREGWDSPNVFQICTLGQATSRLRKRQEIGRGARLAVDQRGRRVRDDEINTLTVVTNDSYEAFVAGLQTEVSEEGHDDAPPPRPARARSSLRSPERWGGSTRDATQQWLTLDSERLVRDAVAALVECGGDGKTVPSPELVRLVSEAVQRAPANVRATRRTIGRVLEQVLAGEPSAGDRWTIAHTVATALVDAVIAQTGPSTPWAG